MKYQFSFRQMLLGVTCGLLILNLLIVLIFGQLFMGRVYITQKQGQLIAAYTKLNNAGFDNTELLAQLETRNMLILAADTETYEVVYSTRMIQPEDQENILKNLFSNTSEALATAWSENYYVSTREDYKDFNSASRVVVNEWITLYGLLDDGTAINIDTACQPVTEAAQLAGTFNLLVGLAAIALGVVILLWMSPKLTNPINDMSRSARAIANQDYSTKCTTNVVVTEFAELAESINKMSDEMKLYITELKNANSSLKRDIEEKVQIEESRKSLLSNISHDLKTPIAIISGYSEGLKTGMANTPQQIKEYSEIISDEADRLQSLIVRLMELSRIESGSIPVEMEDFDLSDTMDYLVSTFSLEAAKKEVEVEQSYEPGIYVMSDYTSVEQTLTNLLQNAISHNIQGGRIKIRMVVAGSRVRISMFNTCLPMDADELPKLWDSFYRRDKSRTRSGGESGLGLAIVKGNMEMLKMPYGVRLEQGGIVFWLELPYSEEAEM